MLFPVTRAALGHWLSDTWIVANVFDVFTSSTKTTFRRRVSGSRFYIEFLPDRWSTLFEAMDVLC